MSSAQPLFTVVVTTRDRPTLLLDAVRSVLAQTVQDFDIVLVDDASNPPAAVPSDGRIRIVRLGVAGGPAKARNVGIRQSGGRYIAFLDDDDLFKPNRLGLTSAPNGHQVTVCGAEIMDQRAWARRWTRIGRRAETRPIRRGAPSSLRPELVPGIGQITIQRDAVPWFDERLRVEEDLDWWIRLTAHHEPHFIPEAGFVRRIHERARIADRNDLTWYLDSTLDVLRKNETFFLEHRGAAAYRWRRVALLYERIGDPAAARTALCRAAEIGGCPPRRWDIARTYLPLHRRLRTQL